MEQPTFLFSRGLLYQALSNRMSGVIAEIRALGGDDLLNEDALALVASRLEAENVIQSPSLTGAYEITQHGETFVPQDDFGQSVNVKYNFYVAAVPYDGDSELFELLPSRWSSRKPMGVVQDSEVEIRILDRGSDPAVINRQIEEQIGLIKEYLATVASDVAQYNQTLRSSITSELRVRFQKLEQDRQVLKGLPLRKKPSP